MELTRIIERCQTLHDDLNMGAVKAWKAAGTDRRAIGYLPTYVPREIIHAAGILPVGILGAGDNLEIVRGDACFQSYICHLPRSVMELGLSGRLDVLDGMVFPSTCDVIRNLSGIWQLEFPDKYVRYLDVPQNFDPAVGGTFYRELLADLFTDMAALAGRSPGDCDLNASISVYNDNRALVRELYELRATRPWMAPASEAYLLLRAGAVLAVEEHSLLMRQYLDAVQKADRPMKDNARVVMAGAFCEQPPLTLLRTLERAGCDLVDDDLLLVMRWLGDEVDETGDGLDTLAAAYLAYQGESSCRYVPDELTKGDRLVASVRDTGAEGVIFAAPSFCDPALLDRPMLQARLTQEGISYTAFKYAENSG
ncbi:MAG: benzoyl-CoA reductase subunit C, partial [Planctomycetota bacterium]